jgi:hypothetical protein
LLSELCAVRQRGGAARCRRRAGARGRGGARVAAVQLRFPAVAVRGCSPSPSLLFLFPFSFRSYDPQTTPNGYQGPPDPNMVELTFGRCVPFRDYSQFCISHYDCGDKFTHTRIPQAHGAKAGVAFHNYAYCDNLKADPARGEPIKVDIPYDPDTGQIGYQGVDPFVPTSTCKMAKAVGDRCLADAQCITDCCDCNMKDETATLTKTQQTKKLCVRHAYTYVDV